VNARPFRGVSDEVIRGPLWGFAPADRPAILHERRRRFGLSEDFEYNVGESAEWESAE
jgi:hypothetical protein